MAPLLSPHGMAVNCGSKCFAYVCEWGAHQVTRVDLASGEKVGVGAISSPSGCAVDAAAGYAYAVQQVRPRPLPVPRSGLTRGAGRDRGSGTASCSGSRSRRRASGW